jgi:hypothetical protein
MELGVVTDMLFPVRNERPPRDVRRGGSGLALRLVLTWDISTQGACHSGTSGRARVILHTKSELCIQNHHAGVKTGYVSPECRLFPPARPRGTFSLL